jgi:hypothetical protein
MHPEGITLHLGINYVVSPTPNIDKNKSLAFQQALLREAIDIDNVRYGDTEIALTRESTPLQIKVIASGPPVVGQLLVLAPNPDRNLEVFGKESEAIVRAFQATWPDIRQIIARDCTLRYLYESSQQHAFKELWEERLGQSEKSLDKLGRPVLGGGLRLIMPSIEGEQDPTQVQVRIESYLRDSKKVFVETEFKWPEAKPPDFPFDPVKLLSTVDEFIENQVFAFILEGRGNNDS